MNNNQIEEKTKNRIIVLYDSKFGNTKKIAISLSRGLEAGGLTVDCISIHDFNIENILSYDVIGLGGPTHFRGMSKPMKEFISEIKKLNLEGKRAFVFETKADFSLAGSSGKKILKVLSKLKLNILYGLISGIVTEQQGSLVNGTLSMMEKFGLEIADIIYSNNKRKEVVNIEQENYS